jgi:hypothetical protein
MTKGMTQKDLKKIIKDLSAQLRLCVSALGLASDTLLNYQPRMVQHFETLIEEIETKLQDIKDV